jgi:hypothetical protein
MGGVRKVAYDRHWSDRGDQCPFFSVFSAILDLILFPFPLTHAEKLVIHRSISIDAANMTVLLITHS